MCSTPDRWLKREQPTALVEGQSLHVLSRWPSGDCSANWPPFRDMHALVESKFYKRAVNEMISKPPYLFLARL